MILVSFSDNVTGNISENYFLKTLFSGHFSLLLIIIRDSLEAANAPVEKLFFSVFRHCNEFKLYLNISNDHLISPMPPPEVIVMVQCILSASKVLFLKSKYLQSSFGFSSLTLFGPGALISCRMCLRKSGGF